MIENYTSALKKGFEKNKEKFLEINNMTLDQMKQIHAEKRFVDFCDKTELKKFEMNGYEQMLARIIEAPMKSAIEHDNVELQKKLSLIKN